MFPGRWTTGIVLATCICLSGCNKSTPVEFQTWSSPQDPYVPVAGSRNSFDDYCEAAKLAFESAPNAASAMNFTPTRKRQYLGELSKAIQKLEKGSGKQCAFEHRVQPYFAPHPYRPGWRILGRALTWQTEEAIAASNWGRVVNRTAVLTKFARDLMGGTAMDADLGLSLMDEQRQVLVTCLENMDAGSLMSLSNLMEREWKSPNWLEGTVRAEREQMLGSVQWLQDRYKAQEWSVLRDNLGDEAREAIDYIERMRGEDGLKRLNYFQSLAKEIDSETDYFTRASGMSLFERSELKPPEAKGAWRRFAKLFFRGMRPLVIKKDKTLTRTKLLGLHCWVRAQAKSKAGAPASLNGIGVEAVKDPLTGLPFGYAATGTLFRLYSIGMDGIDNGGKTDDSFESPDFTLESSP